MKGGVTGLPARARLDAVNRAPSHPEENVAGEVEKGEGQDRASRAERLETPKPPKEEVVLGERDTHTHTHTHTHTNTHTNPLPGLSRPHQGQGREGGRDGHRG